MWMRRLIAALLLGLMVPSLAPVPARATINSTTSKTVALGDGTTTQFNFNFVGVAASYISVIYTDSSGNETTLSQGSGATQYQISLNAPVTGAIWGLGGTVTYSPNSTPIPSGSTLTIFRILPLTQAISLQNKNSLATLGNGAETGLDTGVMQDQQNSEQIGRAIVAPIVDATAPLPLPPIAQRANQAFGFDGSGNPIAMAAPSTGMISSAMQPVVDAASIPLGREALGLGGAATLSPNCGLGSNISAGGNLDVVFQTTQVSSNQSIAGANCGTVYIATGPLTFTLPRANTLWNGFSFWINVIAGSPATLSIDSHDTISNQASGVSGSICLNCWAYITTDAASDGNWRISVISGYPGFQPGTAMMWPNPGQTSGPWNAVDPYARPIDTTGSLSQGLQEFMNASAAAGWPDVLNCGAIPYSGSPTAPSWNPNGQTYIEATTSVTVPVAQDWSFHAHGCVLNFNVTTVPGLVGDSEGASTFDWDGVVVYNVTSPDSTVHGGGSFAVYIHPVTNTDDGFPGLYAGYFRVKAPVSNPVSGTIAGVVGINADTGSTLQMHNLEFGEVNCNDNANYGVVAFGATNTTAVLQNPIKIGQIHGCLVRGAAEGINSSNQTLYQGNQWTINDIEMASSSSAGADTWGNAGTWDIGLMNGAQGGINYCIVTESGAINNNFRYGTCTSPTTGTQLDNGTGSTFISTGLISATRLNARAGTVSALPTCNTAPAPEGSLASVTDATSNTWGAPIVGGSTNHVLVYCDGTGWTVAGK